MSEGGISMNKRQIKEKIGDVTPVLKWVLRWA